MPHRRWRRSEIGRPTSTSPMDRSSSSARKGSGSCSSFWRGQAADRDRTPRLGGAASTRWPRWNSRGTAVAEGDRRSTRLGRRSRSTQRSAIRRSRRRGAEHQPSGRVVGARPKLRDMMRDRHRSGKKGTRRMARQPRPCPYRELVARVDSVTDDEVARDSERSWQLRGPGPVGRQPDGNIRVTASMTTADSGLRSSDRRLRTTPRWIVVE